MASGSPKTSRAAWVAFDSTQLPIHFFDFETKEQAGATASPRRLSEEAAIRDDHSQQREVTWAISEGLVDAARAIQQGAVRFGGAPIQIPIVGDRVSIKIEGGMT